MEKSDTVILNYLDLPPRILLWPVSEVLVVVGPMLLMMIFGRILLGIVLLFISFSCVKFFKRFFGKGSLIGVLYWYLPTSKDQFKVTPPSYIKTFIN